MLSLRSVEVLPASLSRYHYGLKTAEVKNLIRSLFEEHGYPCSVRSPEYFDPVPRGDNGRSREDHPFVTRAFRKRCTVRCQYDSRMDNALSRLWVVDI